MNRIETTKSAILYRLPSIAAIALLLISILLPCFAQERSRSDWFQPLANGDGLRYPLDIAPLTWRLVGSGIYPVKGSDGRMHLAYALMFTNSWNMTSTIKSVEVVDPARGNQVTGHNRVLSIQNEDVTGQVKLFTLPGSMDKASYSSQLPGGQSGVMFFDVTYDDASQVPKSIAHRVTVTIPPNPHIASELTVTSPPIPLGREAMVIAPPFKGDGWVDGNGCCLEIGPHRFVTNPMNGTLEPQRAVRHRLDQGERARPRFSHRRQGARGLVLLRSGRAGGRARHRGRGRS